MSKLVSMKITAAEREKRMEPSSVATDMPAYPWGLGVNLDNESLEKLEIDADDLKVGQTLTLIAKVEVTNLSSNESKGGGSNQSVGLQITEMCLETKGSAAAAADTLYAKKS